MQNSFADIFPKLPQNHLTVTSKLPHNHLTLTSNPRISRLRLASSLSLRSAALKYIHELTAKYSLFYLGVHCSGAAKLQKTLCMNKASFPLISWGEGLLCLSFKSSIFFNLY